VVDFFSGIFGSEALAGVVISNVMLLAAGLLLWELVHFEFKSARISRAAVALLMFGPVSFFFSCAYPEAMFLVLGARRVPGGGERQMAHRFALRDGGFGHERDRHIRPAAVAAPVPQRPQI
jgi:hypothetical protein